MFIQVDEVRTYLRLKSNDNSKDSLIALLIPSVIAELASACGTKDRVIRISTTSISFSEDKINISGLDLPARGFNDKMEIKVTGSAANDGIYSVKSATSNYIQVYLSAGVSFIAENLGLSVLIEKISLPLGLKNTALEMVAYRMNTKIAEGVTSESIGRYSANYSSGYPDSITNTINKFRKVSW